MKYILFTTETCPKCPEVKTYIKEKISFEGELLDNTAPNFMELAGEYGVTGAPTMIIFNDAKKEIFRGSETYEIEDFLKNS